jgi:hypothetical protein
MLVAESPWIDARRTVALDAYVGPSASAPSVRCPLTHARAAQGTFSRMSPFDEPHHAQPALAGTSLCPHPPVLGTGGADARAGRTHQIQTSDAHDVAFPALHGNFLRACAGVGASRRNHRDGCHRVRARVSSWCAALLGFSRSG